MAHFTPEEAKTRNIEKMGESLGEQYSTLWQEVACLHLKWREYIELFGNKSSRVALLNQAAPTFFHLIQDSLWDDIILHIARLTDPPKSVGKRNLTICNLVTLTTASQATQGLPALIDEALEKTRFCRDWRNRRIAHRDLSHALNASASPLAPASRHHVHNALSSIVAVLNKIESIYLDSQTFFEGVPGIPCGALSLLYIIDDGVKAQAERKNRLKREKPSEQDFLPRDL